MIDEKFILIGTILSMYGIAHYLVDTIRGRVRPNRVTWLIWGIAPLIAFFAERHEGVGLVSLMTFFIGFNDLLIFASTFFNKNAYWKLTRMDYVYAGLALVGLLFWRVSGDGNVAILFAIIADSLATMPTILKSYRAPQSESSLVYFLAMANGGITLLTIRTWDFPHWGFPGYVFVVCGILFVLIRFEIGVKVQNTIKRIVS